MAIARAALSEADIRTLVRGGAAKERRQAAGRDDIEYLVGRLDQLEPRARSGALGQTIKGAA